MAYLMAAEGWAHVVTRSATVDVTGVGAVVGGVVAFALAGVEPFKLATDKVDATVSGMDTVALAISLLAYAFLIWLIFWGG